MEKEKVLVLQLEAVIKQVQLIERFGAHLAMLEACETIAGVMVEQESLCALAEHSNENELRTWATKVSDKGRIYSGHLVAIRDALRLCNLVTDLIERANDFIESGGQTFIETLLGETPIKDQ